MACRLCLNSAADNINIFSDENILKCITKFLELVLEPEDPISNVICARCWQELDSFQKFCIEIQKAQQTLNATTEAVKQSNENIKVSLEEEKFAKQLKYIDDGSNLLQKEEFVEEIDDYTQDDIELLFQSDEEIIKVELPNEHESKPAIASSPDTKDHFSAKRVTRQSTLEKSVNSDIPEIVQTTKKRGRPRKGEIIVKKEEKAEEPEHKTDLKNLSSDCERDTKRKRGRPGKGEKVPPKIKMPRSEQCSKMLQTAKEFDAIIQKHMNLSCQICSVRLIDFAELKRHFRAVHQRRGYAVCCNKRLFKRGLVVDHINVHNDPEHFKCTKCCKVLADRMCLRNHDLLFHQTEEQKTFHCAYCPKKYAKQYLLDHHTVKHVPQDECTFFCADCGKGFPTNATLTKHVNQIHSTVYDKMCEICAKLIRGNANFERHMEEHEGIVQPQVQCTECGSWLKDKNSLRKHMYLHDGKTHTCNICGKNAPSKSALQSHMRYVHQLSRMFHCTFCDKSFKKAVNLREHMTTHTGEVLYTCPHCPKTFNSKANMHSHRKKKHREEWEANRRYPKKELKSEVT